MENDIDFVWWCEMIGLIIAACVISMACIGIVSGESISEVEAFLVNDTTDSHEWLTYYSCGHFSRDLTYNASLVNISLGGVILGNSSVLIGYDNHIMNYIMVKNKVYLIEPQTDRVTLLNQSGYLYYRLYPDGGQVPSNWAYNLATNRINLSSPIFNIL